MNRPMPDTPSDTDRQDALTRDEIACAHLASLCTAAMKSGPEVLTVFLNRIETITNEVRQAAGAKRLDKHKREDT